MKAYNFKVHTLYKMKNDGAFIMVMYCGKSSVCLDKYIFRPIIIKEAQTIDIRAFCISPIILTKREVERKIVSQIDVASWGLIQKNAMAKFCVGWVVLNYSSQSNLSTVDLLKYIETKHNRKYNWRDFCK